MQHSRATQFDVRSPNPSCPNSTHYAQSAQQAAHIFYASAVLSFCLLVVPFFACARAFIVYAQLIAANSFTSRLTQFGRFFTFIFVVCSTVCGSKIGFENVSKNKFTHAHTKSPKLKKVCSRSTRRWSIGVVHVQHTHQEVLADVYLFGYRSKRARPIEKSVVDHVSMESARCERFCI